jgi:glyoxylase-like metal-dependent hydrolase (beta-lactamase superfamily II)
MTFSSALRLFALVTLLTQQTVHAQVGFSIIKTSKVSVVERLLVPDGRYTKEVDTNFSAFLIRHHNEYLLFDTGLGKNIEAQYSQDMPYWQRAFFRFERPVVSARQQLDAAGFAPLRQVILSHSHWDHAGGVQDFPEAKILVSQDELSTIAQPKSGAGGTWASQISSASIRWSPITFAAVGYKGYAQSLDLFNDGTVVLVPMPGHTQGSIGMFVTVDSGKCFFFIGDVAWKSAALRQGAAKFWAASLIVDGNRGQTMDSVEKVRDVLRQYPEVVVVPAHDGAVQDALGYFPSFVQ